MKAREGMLRHRYSMETIVFGCFAGLFLGVTGMIMMQSAAMIVAGLLIGGCISIFGPFVVESVRDGKLGFLPKSILEEKQCAMEEVLGIEWTEIPRQRFYRIKGESVEKYKVSPPRLSVKVES